MNKKLQVFVSSTYTDLIEERQAAVEAILDTGHIPAGMELFKAGKSQIKTINRWIDESDVYMLILGGRYGSIEEDSKLSYTELEYQYALSKGMPVFALVVSQSLLTAKINSLGYDKATEQEYPEKYKKFKNLVESKIVKYIDDCKDIKIAIHSTINDFIQEYDFTGWVKNISSHCLYSLKTNSNQNFDKMIIGAKRITISGRNMANIINFYRNALEESIKSGCEYRILLFDYNSEARRILYDEFKFQNYGKKTYKNYLATIEVLEEFQQNYPNFQYKKTNKWTDYSIGLIEFEKEEKNYIQILLYSETMQGNERPMFKINYGDEWYHKFVKELNLLWDSNPNNNSQN